VPIIRRKYRTYATPGICHYVDDCPVCRPSCIPDSGVLVKCALFLFDLNQILNLFKYYRKILKYEISRKSVQWESSSMGTDGQTDMTKLTVTFRSFANSPKKCQSEDLTLICPLWVLGETVE